MIGDLLTDAERAVIQGALEAAMPSRAAISRRSSTRNAAGGRDNTLAPVSALQNVPCHVHPDSRATAGEVEQAGRLVGPERFRMMFPAGTDIRGEDVVAVDGVAYEIVQVDAPRSWALEVEALGVRRG